MTKIKLILLLCFFVQLTVHAQVKIGDNPNIINGGSLLELETTNKGFVPPRVALTGLTVTTPLPAGIITGTIVFNTATGVGTGVGLYFWSGTAWVAIGSGTLGTNWLTGGNDNTTVSASSFLGTTAGTSIPLMFRAGGDTVGYLGLKTTSNAVSFGIGASGANTANSSVAIGAGATASGGNQAVALGSGAVAGSFQDIAIGSNAQTNTTSANIAIGANSQATSGNAIAIGQNATAATKNITLAIGINATSTGFTSMAIGNGSKSNNDNTTAFGALSLASGLGANAFGNRSNATGDTSLAVGNLSVASKSNAIVIGNNSKASGVYSEVFGTNSTASGDSTIVIGNGITASSSNVIILGAATKKIGMGTTTPQEKVDIVGNLRFSGALMPAGSAGTAGQVLTAAGTNNPPTWQNALALNNFSATAPLTYNNSTGVFGITKATTSTDGYLSSADWNIFNNKVSTITLNTPSTIYTNPVSFSVVNGAATGSLSFVNQSANTVFAGPASGLAGTPSFRALVAADLPAGSGNYWNATGNTGTDTTTNFLGTGDNKYMLIKTNNKTAITIAPGGNVSVGMPSNRLSNSTLGVANTIELYNTAATGGSKPAAISQFVFSNSNGINGADVRMNNDGGDFYFQGGGGRNTQLSTYWTILLGGDRQIGTSPGFVYGSNGSDPQLNTGVLAKGQRDASVPFAVQANSLTQTANLTEWRDASSAAGKALSVVDKAGNFGIGITVPPNKLSVLGTNPLYLSGVQATSTFTTDSILTILNGVVKKAPNSALAGNSWTTTGNTGLTATNFIGTTDGIDFVIKTAGVERMRILGAINGSSQAGWVGFNTSTPRSRLDVTGTFANKNVITIQNTDATGYSSIDMYSSGNALSGTFGYANPGVTNTAIAGKDYFYYYGNDFIMTSGNGSGGSPDLFIQGSTGNVGMGTANPGNKLSVLGTNPLYLSGVQATATLNSDSVLTISGGVVKKAPSSSFSGASGWSLIGNGGTSGIAGTNFVGTTDDKGLVFKVGNTVAGVLGTTNDGGGRTSYGLGSSASDQNTTAIGPSAKASAIRAVALGYNAQAIVQDAVAVGPNALANQTGALAVGSGAQATKQNSLSYGNNNVSSGTNSGAMGNNTSVTGDNSLAVGNGSTVTSINTVVIGSGVTVNQANAFILGNPSLSNVGIGTTTPNTNTKLDVAGAYKLGSSGSVINNMIRATPGTTALGTINANTTATFTFPVSNVTANANVIVNTDNSGLVAGLVLAYSYTTAGNVVVVIRNTTAANISAGNASFIFTIIQ